MISDSKDSSIDSQEPLLITSVDQLSSSSISGVYLLLDIRNVIYTTRPPNEACTIMTLCSNQVCYLVQNPLSHRISRFFEGMSKNINLKALFAPSTIGAVSSWVLLLF